MKRLLPFVLTLLLVSLVHAQQRDGVLPRPSPNATVSQTIGITDVTLGYSRPAVRGRVLFGPEGSGALEAYGKVWRLGANEATTITFSTDVMVEDQSLAAGTYAFFAIPGVDEWTFVFNRTANQWGAFNYDANEDALRVTATPTEGPNVENLLFWFDEVTTEQAELMMAWGTIQAGITISTDTDALVAAAAEGASPTATDWRVPFRYATYALGRGMDPVAPLVWAEKAVSLNNAYATVALKARLQAAAGDLESAIATGEAALALGEAMESRPGDLGTLREALTEWRAKMQ